MTAGEPPPCDAELHGEPRGPQKGSPLVFLHGLGSNADAWAWQIPAFDDRYRVIALDLPGHGRTAGGAARAGHRVSVEGMARSVGRFLDGVDERPAHVVGLSLGGCVALALALHAPARVRTLTLVNAFARLRPASLQSGWRMLERVALLAVAPMPVVAARVARGLFPEPGQDALRAMAAAALGRNDKRAYLAAVRAVARFDVRARLAEIRCPTLLVVGARDTTVPRAAADLMAQRIAGARLAVVPGSGHATPCDRPEPFNRLLADFIASH